MRLKVEVVRRLERLLGGDPVTEGLILRFIKRQYGADTLADLSEQVAREITRRPDDFMRAVQRSEQPELF